MPPKKKPVGLFFLCLALIVISAAGVICAGLIVAGKIPLAFYFGPLALVASVGALGSAILFLRFDPRGVNWFRAFCLAVAWGFVLYLPSVDRDATNDVLLAVGLALFLGGGLYSLNRFVTEASDLF